MIYLHNMAKPFCDVLSGAGAALVLAYYAPGLALFIPIPVLRSFDARSCFCPPANI